MSGMWRKTLVYLGLVEDAEETEVRGVAPEAARTAAGAQPPPPAPPRRGRRAEPGSARRLGGQTGTVRPLPTAEARSSHVRQLNGAAVRVGIVRAASFDDAEEIGERYRSGQPVVLDLNGVDVRTGRRLLDFVSGVIFALRGSITPAGERAFLLVPEGADLSFDERRRLADLGYDVTALREG